MKFIKSYGQYLNENVNEAKKMRVKRKYGQYEATQELLQGRFHDRHHPGYRY